MAPKGIMVLPFINLKVNNIFNKKINSSIQTQNNTAEKNRLMYQP